MLQVILLFVVRIVMRTLEMSKELIAYLLVLDGYLLLNRWKGRDEIFKICSLWYLVVHLPFIFRGTAPKRFLKWIQGGGILDDRKGGSGLHHWRFPS